MASTVAELMRRRFGGKKGEVDPLDGWTIGYRLNTAGEVSSDICCISPYLNAAAGSTVLYCNPQTGSVNKGIWTYNENLSGSYLQWAVRDARVNSFMMPQDRTKFRITMYVSAIDNSYIMDENGNYIWKGKNV